MKTLIFNIRTYTNFCLLCKLNKIKHDYSIYRGNIIVTADNLKLEELGY